MVAPRYRLCSYPPKGNMMKAALLAQVIQIALVLGIFTLVLNRIFEYKTCCHSTGIGSELT